ncbi:MAG: ABC transporter substrate-binding protein [Gammaproteobacteria bacterium]|nr:ABC transporter substrate-binding protein [Gammaproteobacteria bacterium]
MRITLFILSLCSLLLLSCSDNNSQILRLGTNVWPGYEPLYLARDLNYLDNMQVELLELSSASEVLQAFRSRALDAASLTLDEVLLLRDLDIPVTVVLVHDVSDGGDVVIAKPAIKTIVELRNKRVGVENGALGAYVITRALELNDMVTNDIVVVQSDVNTHESYFKTGMIDAVVTFEPVRTRLLTSGGNEIFSSREMPDEIVDVLAVHNDYLTNNPAIIKDLISAWFKALEYMKTESDHASARMARRLNISQREVNDSYHGLKLPDKAQNIKLLSKGEEGLGKSINNLYRVMRKQKLIRNEISTDALLSNQYLTD